MLQISGEVVKAVIDIQGTLLSVQEQAFQLQKENYTLQTEINTLKSSTRVLYEGNARWEHLPDGTVDGPLCDICLGISVRL